jgi:hypothetical protein
MYLEFILLLVFAFFYFVVYVELKINKESVIHRFEGELTRKNLQNETFIKSPFLFNGKHLNSPIQKSSLTLIEKRKSYTKYKKVYENILLLEPYTRCNTSNEVYYINENRRLPILKERCGFNYYIVKSGKAKIAMVHPKYKDNFHKKEKEFIHFLKENQHIPFIECHENTILFIPNEWMVYVENTEKDKLILEIIHYQTLVNQIIYFVKKNIMKSNEL